jgi:exodeoxyribonuclease-3
MLRIATWNVNSLRVRLETLLPWLVQDGPDVVCLQETKVTDDLFPIQALADVGYQVAFTGQKTYNGVALLSRLPMTDVLMALPGAPLEDEKRFIAATIAGVRVINVYVPNGPTVGAPKFYYKLTGAGCRIFYCHLYRGVVLLCGDLYCPGARDLTTLPKQKEILFHPDERAVFARFLAWGLWIPSVASPGRGAV